MKPFSQSKFIFIASALGAALVLSSNAMAQSTSNPMGAASSPDMNQSNTQANPSMPAASMPAAGASDAGSSMQQGRMPSNQMDSDRAGSSDRTGQSGSSDRSRRTMRPPKADRN